MKIKYTYLLRAFIVLMTVVIMFIVLGNEIDGIQNDKIFANEENIERLYFDLKSNSVGVTKLDMDVERLEKGIDELKNEVENLNYLGFPSFEAEITYYDLCVGCCGKDESNPAYGITASGKYVKENHTIAAPKNVPFGTKLLINGIIYTVEDRGGAIVGNKLDIYVKDHETGYKMGGKHNEVVYILQWGE